MNFFKKMLSAITLVGVILWTAPSATAVENFHDLGAATHIDTNTTRDPLVLGALFLGFTALLFARRRAHEESR